MAEEELYCTCKQPADDRFMIACDKCEERVLERMKI